MAKAKEVTSALATLQDALAEETSGYNPQSVVVKIQHQEGQFKIPSLPATKRLIGVVLASRRVRVFYPRMGVDADTDKLLAFTSNRPFCSSVNYSTGTIVDADFDSLKDDDVANFLRAKIADGGGTCKDCPFNVWGSVELLGKDGRGKACAELRRLLFWREGVKVPILLPVPVSSIRNWDAYCSSLEAAGMKHNQVITEIDLESKEAPGRKWSVISFEAADPIDEATAEELMVEYAGLDGTPTPLWQILISIFKGRELGTDEYPDNGHGSEETTDDDL